MKEKLFNITILLMSITAILQLAASQIHIKTITKVFVTEIGFYLFLFIIFGLVTLFNLTTIKKSTNDFMFVLCSLVVSGVGIKYLQLLLNDYNSYDSIKFKDIYESLYMVIAGIAIYAFGTIYVVISKKNLRKSMASEKFVSVNEGYYEGK